MHVKWLQERLTQALPGALAHAPYMRYRKQFANGSPQKRPAAVAIHFYYTNEEWYFILIERSSYNGQHSGQMAFPGGKPEATDPHLEFTARRESFEEIGIPISSGQHLQTLSKVWIPVSGFEVSPFVFLHEAAPLLQPDPREVQEIICVALSDLLKEESCIQTDIRVPEGTILKDHPCFFLNDKIVWGATALMLNELRMLLG
ncbi:MAG: NUDIX hydrolase [Flavobacteriales bacterium]